MTSKVSVKLTSAAKIGGKFHPAGATPEVTLAQLADLVTAGAVPDQPDLLFPQDAQSPDLEAAIARAELAEGRAASLEDLLTAAQAEATKLQAAVSEAEAQRDLLQERVLELQAGTPAEEAAKDVSEAGSAETVEQMAEGEAKAEKAPPKAGTGRTKKS